MLSDATRSLEATAHQRELAHLHAVTEEVRGRLAAAEQRCTRQDVLVADLRERLATLEGDGARARSEDVFRQKQIETVVQGVDEARAAVVDHRAQLDYLAQQTKQWRESQLSPTQQKWWALVQWVYMPALHVVKGAWVIAFPAVETFRRLSLFRRSSEGKKGRVDSDTESDERNGLLQKDRGRAAGTKVAHQNATSLLSLLMEGALDPTSAP